MTKLTCVIPVFNGERYIEETLRCVAAQTRRPDRLIVLDNCSTDSTRKIVEGFAGIKAEWRQNETNLGLFGNFNRALGFATETEYLHLLMADDLVLPTFYEKTVAALEGVKGIGMAYSFHETIDGFGKVIGPLTRQAAGPARRVPKMELLKRQSEMDTVLLPGVLFKTSGRAAPCLFREMPQVADNVFIAEWAAASEEIWEIPEYLCQYRWHPLGTTSKNIRSFEYWIMDEWRTMELVSGLMTGSALEKWLRGERLKCIFAGRSQDKADVMRNSAPEYAREIAAGARRLVSWRHWVLGKIALRLRDAKMAVTGKKSKLKEALGVE